MTGRDDLVGSFRIMRYARSERTRIASGASRKIMQKRAPEWRAPSFNASSTTNVVLLEQRLVARLVVLLQIVQQRTARRHQLQVAAAGMVVLAVGLEMAGEVVDAFRQDRDLHLRRTGVASLERARLDDFRFAFG